MSAATLHCQTGRSLDESFPVAVFAQSDPTSNVTVGGADPLERNIISGNRGDGVYSRGQARILNNYIGTNAAGDSPMPNTHWGIHADAGLPGLMTIGGTAAGTGNLIQNNGSDGINLDGTGGGSLTVGNTISNNSGAGVHVVNSSNNSIGGVGGANTITNNTGAGVRVENGVNNNIERNSIYGNGALGIDLGPAGVTLNDADDTDEGANHLQNFPILGEPVISSSGDTEFEVSLQSRPNTAYRIDFYSNAVGDPSNHGQGQTFLSTHNVTTDDNGRAAFAFVSDGALPAGTSCRRDRNRSEWKYVGVFLPRRPLLRRYPARNVRFTRCKALMVRRCSHPRSLVQHLIS